LILFVNQEQIIYTSVTNVLLLSNLFWWSQTTFTLSSFMAVAIKASHQRTVPLWQVYQDLSLPQQWCKNLWNKTDTKALSIHLWKKPRKHGGLILSGWCWQKLQNWHKF